MPLAAFYSPGFEAPLGQHQMPIRKFALVAEALKNDPRIRLVEPEPVTPEQLGLVHSADYIEAVRTGKPRALAESQKFPWSPRLFPSVCLTNGGLLAAAHSALRNGVAAAVASGFHHSCHDHGEGFCTFNGLVLAAQLLRDSGAVRNVAVLDLDLHYGNGTATLAASRPWLRALSIYGNDYWQNMPYRDVTVRHHDDGPNHHSIALPAGCDGPHLQRTLAKALPWLIAEGKPDLLLFQAGADPFHEDPYSPLALDFDDLQTRDRTVFEFARSHGIPIAWVLAGGYTEDVSKIVRIHVNTFHSALDVFSNL